MLKTLSAFCAVVMLLTLVPFIPAAAVASGGALLTPGLLVLVSRSDAEMVISVSPGDEVPLTAADFERTVGTGIEFITVTSRPAANEGQLVMGTLVLPEGQSITASNLSRISYASSPTATGGVFNFTADGSPYEYTCRVVVRQKGRTNAAPSLSCVTAAALTARAYSGYEYGGVMAGSDPDGDMLTYIITSYPRHGSIYISDSGTGKYVYMPTEGYTGRDSFSYTVRDEWGACADGDVSVNISVTRPSITVDYEDLSGTDVTAALTLTAAGLMSGTQVGAGCYFYPDQSVSRVEYLVLAMEAAGIESLPVAEKTVFADDNDIPPSMKSYVVAAYELGYVSGWIVDGKQCFLPDESISLAEAAFITSAVLGIPAYDAVPVSSVSGASPVWARGAVAALAAGGFPVTGGETSGTRTMLSRADAAGLLCAVMRHIAAK